MTAVILSSVYVLGFLFFLGFFLEEVEGALLLRPLLVALAWPILIFFFAFSFGCRTNRALYKVAP